MADSRRKRVHWFDGALEGAWQSQPDDDVDVRPDARPYINNLDAGELAWIMLVAWAMTMLGAVFVTIFVYSTGLMLLCTGGIAFIVAIIHLIWKVQDHHAVRDWI